jgi:hypothetical protein
MENACLLLDTHGHQQSDNNYAECVFVGWLRFSPTGTNSGEGSEGAPPEEGNRVQVGGGRKQRSRLEKGKWGRKETGIKIIKIEDFERILHKFLSTTLGL